MNKLEALKKHTIVVADTGDFNSIAKFKPQDGTTNPSLILQVAKKEEYANLVNEGVKWAKENSTKYATASLIDLACEKITANFVTEAVKLVPGRVSIESNVTTSFNQEKIKEAAYRLLSILSDMGVTKDRILIKIASTWEGICAAKELEKENINCNLTLLFSKAQAIACAQAKVFLVSPFVGRILDWHKSKEGKDFYKEQDPGVISVKDIYNYYKKFDYKTIVMGASFRNIGEIEELCGVDRLTISPKLLAELQASEGEMPVSLSPERAKLLDIEKIDLDEEKFRWMHNQDAMAVEKLSEGIRSFAKDLQTLQQIVESKL